MGPDIISSTAKRHQARAHANELSHPVFRVTCVIGLILFNIFHPRVAPSFSIFSSLETNS